MCKCECECEGECEYGENGKPLLVVLKIMGNQSCESLKLIKDIFREGKKSEEFRKVFVKQTIFAISDYTCILYTHKAKKTQDLHSAAKVAVAGCAPVIFKLLDSGLEVRGEISFGDEYVDLMNLIECAK